jgi:hypothetical protein
MIFSAEKSPCSKVFELGCHGSGRTLAKYLDSATVLMRHGAKGQEVGQEAGGMSGKEKKPEPLLSPGL